MISRNRLFVTKNKVLVQLDLTLKALTSNCTSTKNIQTFPLRGPPDCTNLLPGLARAQFKLELQTCEDLKITKTQYGINVVETATCVNPTKIRSNPSPYQSCFDKTFSRHYC